MCNSKKPGFILRAICMLLAVVCIASSFSLVVMAEEVETASDAATADVAVAEDEKKAEETKKDDSDNVVSADGSTNKKEELSDDELRKVQIEGFEKEGEYSDYLEKYAKYDKKLEDIVIKDLKNYAPFSKELDENRVKVSYENEYEGKDGVILIKRNEKADANEDEEGVIDYSVEFNYEIQVPESGLYSLELTYFSLIDSITRDYEFCVYVDGEKPFASTESLTLKRNWDDENDKIKKDKVGNELLPTQVIKPKWITADFYDPNGNYNESLKYFLSKGKHKITIKSVSGSLAIDEIRFHNDGELISYSDYIAENNKKGAKDAKAKIDIQAENYADKSDSILQMVYDRSDPLVKPYSVSTTKLNTFGGSNWNTSLQRVNYEITVEKSGYYELTFRYRQSFMRGTTVYRRLLVDDEVPFKEADALAFKYGSGYQVTTAGKNVKGKFQPYKIYLEKGTHTLSLQAVIGDMAEISREVETAVFQLNFIYRKIIMITGTSPDTFRDYELFENVDNLKAMFIQVNDSLKAIKKKADKVATNKGGESEILNTLSVQIESFIKKPYTIPTRLSTFKDNISSLGSWMINIRDIPLQLDRIVLAGHGYDKERYKANFFEKTGHEVKAFVSSFVDDYTSIGTSSDGKERMITAWVGTGRDQAIALKTLVDDKFSPETGIGVNVSLVPLSVLSKAIVAGRGPDVALHISRTEPLNLGFRNALVNLKEFKDFDEVVKERYTDYAMTPYVLQTEDKNGKKVDKAFGLPETQNFTMMFYRKDVFEELNIEVPNTWDEFDQILPIIQENNMSVGIESAISTNLFYTFIMQGGGQVYEEDGSATKFTEEYAVEAFTKWTDYYTLYSFPLSYSWYTRFRNGEMPLVFESYSNITYLAESAPELAGLWGVAPIPGTWSDVDENGNKVEPYINRMEGSVGLSACSIVVSKDKDPKVRKQKKYDSWEFLKWWTSEEIMVEYGIKVEMAIGPVARYTTANIHAFEGLNWTSEEAAAIRSQRKWVREIPELVGGYYVSRSIVNAFRNVTNNYTNPREMLFYYNEQINDEIWRKRMEYDLWIPKEAKK